MKIVATIPQTYTSDKFLVEMTKDEIQLLTCHSASTERIYVGNEYKVAERYKRLMSLESNREQLNKAIKQLRAVADVIEPLESIVSGEMPIEEVKEQQ